MLMNNNLNTDLMILKFHQQLGKFTGSQMQVGAQQQEQVVMYKVLQQMVNPLILQLINPVNLEE